LSIKVKGLLTRQPILVVCLRISLDGTHLQTGVNLDMGELMLIEKAHLGVVGLVTEYKKKVTDLLGRMKL
jgi:hypothetical protein